jgi:hypothetical protein
MLERTTSQKIMKLFDMDNYCCKHDLNMWEIINHLRAYFVLLQVDHLSQMDGHHCHLVHKQANDYEIAL